LLNSVTAFGSESEGLFATDFFQDLTASGPSDGWLHRRKGQRV
jgi:hypothetical protein